MFHRAEDSGLNGFPLQGFDRNRHWLLIVQLAGDLLAWMGLLASTRVDARRPEPKTLRVRLFTTAATLVRTARRKILHVKNTSPWAGLITTGWNALATLSPP